MPSTHRLFQTGIPAALGAAALFGASTPLAKLLLAGISPWMLAGLLYLGSGLGLMLYRRLSGATAVRLPKQERGWFAGAIIAGGIIAPVLLMLGLTGMPASGASLLLNAEGVFTALLAWFAFRENVDRRIALGMLAIVAGALVLSWPGEARFSGLWPTLAVLGACFAWGLDNNLTRKVSLNDATWIAAVKGLVAGAVNLTLALAVGNLLPALPLMVGAMLLGEAVTLPSLAAGLLMALGLWLHLTEHHAHAHQHDGLEHEHAHTHDSHHQHDFPVTGGEPHSHWHRHVPLWHEHAHFPDAYHQHSH